MQTTSRAALRADALATVKLAATYIGSVVGAGFASGQEGLQFFVSFGQQWRAAIAISGLLFIGYGVTIMGLAYRVAPSHTGEFLEHVFGRAGGRAFDIILMTFSLSSLCVMLAGGGALFQQQLGVRPGIGVFITAAITGLTVLAGAEGVARANVVMVPWMIISAVIVGVRSRLSIHPAAGLPVLAWGGNVLPTWQVAAVVYVSYNILLGIGVLASMGRSIPSPRAAIWGGSLGGLCLTILAAIITATMAPYRDALNGVEVPMLYIAQGLGSSFAIGYALAIWFAMITTATACAFTLGKRIAGTGYLRLEPGGAGVLISIGAMGPAMLGFSRLVGTIYPSFGYVGLACMVFLALAALRTRKIT
ncbi:MAG TPA: hypothetical protein GXX51_10175 [Firmicutes bacterium]|nr:hypothetical protein [Bacillota bacterium]